MHDLDVAVIIVSYKSAGLVIDCLRSVDVERSTPGLRIRVVVIDNQSGDASIISEAIQTNRWSPWVTIIEAPKNGGFAYGNNIAIQRAYDDAPPDYVHLLNPDTIVREGAIGELVRFLETHPDIGIAGSSTEDADGDAWPYAFRFPSMFGEVERGLGFWLASRLMQRWIVQKKMGSRPEAVDWVGGASMMIRRRVLDSIGGLDDGYFLWYEETDFCARARDAGFPTWYVPGSRVMHLGQQSTKASNHGDSPKRLTAPWFQSRNHYFVSNRGMCRALAIDIAALAANALGSAKRVAQGKSHLGIPHFTRDLLHHSLLWSANRRHARIKNIPRFTDRDSHMTCTKPTAASAIAGESQRVQTSDEEV